MYLATFPGRATIGDVARLFGISINHVAKVVNLLARVGYVRSTRGIGGGIELAINPGEVSIGEIIRACDGNLQLLECVSIENVCGIQKFCKLKGVLAEAERIQLEYLNSVMLSEVIPQRRQLENAGKS